MKIVNENQNGFTKREWSTLFVGIVLSMGCILFEANQLNAFSTIGTFLLVLYSVKKSNIERLYLAALAISNTRAMEFFGISGAIGVCAVGAIITILKKRTINTKIFCISILYFCYSLQFILRYQDFTNGLIMPLKTVFIIWFFYFISNDDSLFENPINVIYCTSRFMFFGILSAVFASWSIGMNDARFSVVNNDSNMLSVEIVFLLSVYCILYFRFSVVSKVEFLLATVLLSIICVICGSRTGLVLLAVVMLTAIIFNINRVDKTIAFAAIMIVALVAFVSSSVGRGVINVLVDRSAALASQGNILNGRNSIWNLYISKFNETKYLWLLGMGSYKHYGIEYMAHNFLIEDIAMFGLIGIIMLYGMYIMIFKNAVKNILFQSYYGKTKIYTIIPFTIPIVGGMTLHGLTNIPNTLMLFCGAMVIAIGKIQKKPTKRVNSNN